MSQVILLSSEMPTPLSAEHVIDQASDVASERFLLCDCVPGEACRVVGISGNRAFINRLMGLGLRIGSEIRVVQQRGQDVVIASTGNRVALGGAIARHLQVERLN